MIIRVKELEYFYIQESISIMLPRAAERGGQRGGGGVAPGLQVLGAPRNFLFKYFRAKGKIFGFFGQSTEIRYEKLR
jgi:hypothetical protein